MYQKEKKKQKKKTEPDGAQSLPSLVLSRGFHLKTKQVSCSYVHESVAMNCKAKQKP